VRDRFGDLYMRRHREERSDEAIHSSSVKDWIASLACHRAGHSGPDPLACNDDQCTLTVSSCWLMALATAASRLSVSMIGVPSAACRANSFSPG
jgi:hypothetical protein